MSGLYFLKGTIPKSFFVFTIESISSKWNTFQPLSIIFNKYQLLSAFEYLKTISGQIVTSGDLEKLEYILNQYFPFNVLNKKKEKYNKFEIKNNPKTISSIEKYYILGKKINENLKLIN